MVKISELPVAVVNKDQHATFNNNTLSVGDDMVKSLKKNDALDFHFVSEAKAKKGLEKGDYYMIITLPSDLSQRQLVFWIISHKKCRLIIKRLVDIALLLVR